MPLLVRVPLPETTCCPASDGADTGDRRGASATAVIVEG